MVTTAEVEQIWRAGDAIFIDVLPHAPRPANLPPGTIWREKPHRNIPGSIWLPDTGYGALAPVTRELPAEQSCASDARRSSKGFWFIVCDCWMSWNAAKRILGMGYANVIWYPDGIDGWTEVSLPLQEAVPEPAASQ